MCAVRLQAPRPARPAPPDPTPRPPVRAHDTRPTPSAHPPPCFSPAPLIPATLLRTRERGKEEGTAWHSGLARRGGMRARVMPSHSVGAVPPHRAPACSSVARLSAKGFTLRDTLGRQWTITCLVGSISVHVCQFSCRFCSRLMICVDPWAESGAETAGACGLCLAGTYQTGSGPPQQQCS